MENWREKYKSKYATPEEAARAIKSGDYIVTSMSSGIPYMFLDALADRADELENVTVHHLSFYKSTKLGNPKNNGHIKVVSAFLSTYERAYQQNGFDISYQPMHLSNINEHRKKNATVLAAVGTAPDENGMISLGPCPMRSDLRDTVEQVIIQINENLPYVGGDYGTISVNDVDLMVDGTEDLISIPAAPISAVEESIGGFIAEMVPDGACLQLGIGSIGTAVGNFLKGKKDLGLHTEMFVEAMVGLIECGAVNNSRKELCQGVSVFGFASGSSEMYRFLDHNPLVESRPFDFVNSPRIIAQLSNMVSINSAMQIDLTGQVCAESVGIRQYSGTGGQADFVRGANWSCGGMSFIALPSSRVDKSGERFSKISLTLPAGSAVTTPRSDVQYIVTEFGVANLRGASLSERAEKLISIAHPDFREQLRKEAKKAGLLI